MAGPQPNDLDTITRSPRLLNRVVTLRSCYYVPAAHFNPFHRLFVLMAMDTKICRLGFILLSRARALEPAVPPPVVVQSAGLSERRPCVSAWRLNACPCRRPFGGPVEVGAKTHLR